VSPNYRKYDNKQVTLVVISPEIKETNPLLAIIEDFVDNRVSLELFEAKVHNHEVGAPCVHPKMMLKVLLYAYAEGVRSLRKLERLVATDPHYIYLAGNDRVDHSTISIFLTKYGEEIVEVFKGMVYVLEESGYIGGKEIAIDGSKVRANAGRRFTGTVEDFKRKEKRIAKELKGWVERCKSDADEGDVEKKRKVLERNRERIGKFLSQLGGEEKGLRNLTDTDCRAVRDGEGNVIMGYNGQVGVDGKHHLIVGAEVFNEASDSVLLEPMLDNIEVMRGKALAKGTKVLVDAGFFSGENVQKSGDRGLDAYIPEGKGEDGKKGGYDDMVSSRSCKLELEGKARRLICPGGQTLGTDKTKLKYKKAGKEYRYYVFRADREYCKGCSLYERCYVRLKPDQAKTFSVKREYFDSLIERVKMQAKLSSPEGKRCMRRRGSIVEHVFGSIKEHLGLRRFLLRGLHKVRIQWLLTCMGYNFAVWSKLEYG
jgi:transposase